MKKFLALILVVVMMVSMSSCGTGNESEENNVVKYAGTYINEDGKY